jgi:hypothetical protein
VDVLGDARLDGENTAFSRPQAGTVHGLDLRCILRAGAAHGYNGRDGPLGKVYVKWMHVSIAWLVVPLAAWAGVLLLRPRQPEARRAVLFLIGTGLAITLVVDTVVVVGDIGRMNTVFKFYLQVWALFAVCAAVVLGRLWGTIRTGCPLAHPGRSCWSCWSSPPGCTPWCSWAESTTA